MEQARYERFKALMEELMTHHQVQDENSGYQMYSYPEFNNRTRRILNKCSSIGEAIRTFEVEDPDGWIPESLRELGQRC